MTMQIDIRKLSILNQMAKQGANTVANHLNQMTGMQAEMEITKINFLEISDIRTHIGHEKQVGIHIELVEQPYGYILFLFTAKSAKQLAHGMMGGMGERSKNGFSDMEKSAVQEIGNIMTSGFIDGWANVLQTTIDFSTPEFTYGPGSKIVDSLVNTQDDVAMVVDSRVHVPEEDVELKVYSFPKLEELVGLMRQIEI
ncbi:chemotaxis protein CheC [Halomicrococcus gelatinilyticus]|uniref:chemotaxis protein CheC n=1 Tax=Halomicrococcus gelatinilyticus TaxID=1702103 RepID=UPI002E104A6D